jgi:release factor glutamine methyltransferase
VAENECVGDAARRVARSLSAAGVDTPEYDARLLVAAAIGAVPGDLILRPERRLDGGETQALDASARRRISREPVSRILGEREFYGRRFVISPATLDPRPCSETLIQAVLDIVEEAGWQTRPLRLIDVGTGSGCLIITLLAELANATAVATDVSAEALDVARRNAELAGTLDRLTFLQLRSLHGVTETFDILVSNPPYIPAGDIATLDPEVKDFDPRGALDGGADGLDVYRDIAADISRVVPRGWAAFEVGAGQARDVESILRRHAENGATSHCRTWLDLGGHTRCVAIETHP